MDTMSRLGFIRGVGGSVAPGVSPDSGSYFGGAGMGAQVYGQAGVGGGVGIQATGVVVLVLLGLVVWSHFALR